MVFVRTAGWGGRSGSPRPVGPVAAPVAGSGGRCGGPMLTPSDHLLQSPAVSGHLQTLLRAQAEVGKALKIQK